MPQSPDIGQNSHGVISDFQISGHSLIKVNCRKSRTIDDIDMKLGPATKLNKRNKTMSKKLEDDVMSSRHCHFSNLWSIWSNPEAGLQRHSL